MTRFVSIAFLFVACVGGVAYGQTKGDECDSAFVANIGSNSFDTTNFSSSWPLPDESQCPETYLDWGQSNRDVWFVLSVMESGDYTFSTCDSASFDTSMVLYEDSCDNQVACNGNGPGCANLTSVIYYTCEAGKDYYVRIGGYQGGAWGEGSLIISGGGGTGGKGACCIDETECFISDREYCLAQGGEWTKGADCSSINCGGGSSWGACCVQIIGGGYECYDGKVGKDHNESICLEYGGEWTDDADCESIQCPPSTSV